MSEFTNENFQQQEIVKSNVALGIIGALVGALIGAAIWFGLYQIGIIASIAGIAIVTLACKGYGMLSKRLDGKGVVISIIIAVIMLLAVHGFCWGYEIYITFKVDYEITLMDAIVSIPEVVSSSDLTIEFFKELLIGFILIAVGATPFVKKSLHNRKVS